MTVKTFRDGDRLVLVFEGLENIPSTEDMIKGIVSTVVAKEVVSEPEAVAKPVPVKEEKAPKIPEEKFVGGHFDGMTRSEALAHLKSRFANTNPAEYAAKLTESQRHAFFKQLGQMIPKGERDISKIIKSWKQA